MTLKKLWNIIISFTDKKAKNQRQIGQFYFIFFTDVKASSAKSPISLFSNVLFITTEKGAVTVSFFLVT